MSTEIMNYLKKKLEESKNVITKKEFLDMLIHIFEDYKEEGMSDSIRRNKATTGYEGEEIPEHLIESIIIDFINYAGLWQGINLGFQRKYMKGYNKNGKKLKIDFPQKMTHFDNEKMIDKIGELINKINDLENRLEDLEGKSVRNGWDDD